jgi:hypothetical protein
MHNVMTTHKIYIRQEIQQVSLGIPVKSSLIMAQRSNVLNLMILYANLHVHKGIAVGITCKGRDVVVGRA